MVITNKCTRKEERKRDVIDRFSNGLCSGRQMSRCPVGTAVPRGRTVPEAPGSPLLLSAPTSAALQPQRAPLPPAWQDPSPDLPCETAPWWGFSGFWQNRSVLGTVCPRGAGWDLLGRITAAPTTGRAALGLTAFAPLPVGVLPPPVGQHKVRMAEDRGEAEGLRDLPEGDGEVSGQDLEGTKHRRRRGRCQAVKGARAGQEGSCSCRGLRKGTWPHGMSPGGAASAPTSQGGSEPAPTWLLPSRCPPRPPARGSPW